MKITYVKGDLFKSLPDTGFLLPHCANHVGATGGFAGALAQNFPKQCEIYRRDCEAVGTKEKDFLWRTIFTPISYSKCTTIAHMICQRTLNGPSVRNIRYDELMYCMTEVRSEFLNGNYDRIISCKFGSFLGGLNWSFVECLIEDIWLSEKIPVTIYYL